MFPEGDTCSQKVKHECLVPKNCQKMSFSIVVSAHITPKTNQYVPEIFRHQQLPKYFIFMYIKCTCYAQSKRIFSELFWHKPLNVSAPIAAKGYHFYMDSVHLFPKPQTTFPGRFQHQELPEYSILMCIECAYYSKGKAISSKIFQHQQLPKYSIFMCIDCAYYSQDKIIFHFHMDSVQMFPEPQTIFPKSFSAKSCQNISFLHVLSAHDIPKANQHSPKYFAMNSC